MKILEDLKKETNPSVIDIANNLIKRSENDALIKNSLDKDNKSLQEMWNYIVQEARKNVIGQCASYPDNNVIYEMALHYYDEDDIKVTGPIPNVKVASAPNEESKQSVSPQKRVKRIKDKSHDDQLSIFDL